MEGKKSDENTDELTRAILETVLFVAIKLQQGRALLLPQAVTIFLANYPHPPEVITWNWNMGWLNFS